jgi:glucosyl-3-phosphoglycerate synthase
MQPRFSFAVVGHNEAATVAHPLALAFEAAEPGDSVWFVDSASTDDSASVAAAAGADVLAAPLGKGRAMAAALEQCEGDYLCFLDADFEQSETNIAARLREAAVTTRADMVVAEFDEPGRRRTVTPTIYYPLLSALFPDAEHGITVPLSGFRAVRADLDVAPLPPGYGVETHLNVCVSLLEGTVTNQRVGWFRGKLRGYANIPQIGADVAGTLLDLAERHGRLDPDRRTEWDAWVDIVLDALRDQPPAGSDDGGYVDELLALADRPLPPSR